MSRSFRRSYRRTRQHHFFAPLEYFHDSPEAKHRFGRIMLLLLNHSARVTKSHVVTLICIVRIVCNLASLLKSCRQLINSVANGVAECSTCWVDASADDWRVSITGFALIGRKHRSPDMIRLDFTSCLIKLSLGTYYINVSADWFDAGHRC